MPPRRRGSARPLIKARVTPSSSQTSRAGAPRTPLSFHLSSSQLLLLLPQTLSASARTPNRTRTCNKLCTAVKEPDSDLDQADSAGAEGEAVLVVESGELEE